MNDDSHFRFVVRVVASICLGVATAVMVRGLGDVNIAALWDACRRANPYLAGAAWFAVSIRFGMMLADRRRWRDRRALHLLAWFAWIVASLLVSSLGSSHYADGPTPANYTSALRSVLNVAAIGLAIWWPHPLRYTPAGQERDAP